MPMIEVLGARLGLDSSTNTYVVILQEKDGSRLLPIWIGQPEAEAIVMQMNNVKRERPLTHDLCKSLILGLGASLRRVHITKVQHRTYFAELHLHYPGGEAQIDARPSDSIAVALRLQAPIFVEESLLASAGDESDGEETEYTSPPATPRQAERSDPLSAEQLKQYLENL